MLIYRGQSKIGEWNMREPDQILNGLYINLMHTQTIIDGQISGEIPESLRGIKDDTPTITECNIFMDCINSIKNFILFVRDNGYAGFDNQQI